MLKAKLDSLRKNKKGFSLIELIIVIAIMVALIAILAPSFVKYVQKSRDAAMTTAAEDFASAVKVYFSDEDSAYAAKDAAGTIVLAQVTEDGKNYITTEDSTVDDEALDALIDYAKLDTSKAMGKSDLSFTITITSDGNVTCAETEAPASNS